MKPADLPRVWRTVRHMTAWQMAAQVRHRLRGGVRPRRLRSPVPTLCEGVPRAPFLPAPAHARWDGETLELLRRRVPFGPPCQWAYAEESPLFAYHLHQHDFLRHPAVTPAQRAAVMLEWIDANPEGVGWDPHPLGLRCVAWLKLLATPGALALEAAVHERVRRSLADQVETLTLHPEIHLQANHLLSNRMAGFFAGLLCAGPAADAWLQQGGPLRKQLAEQIGADGAHYERSPMYHAHLLENLLDCCNAATVGGRAPAPLREVMTETAARMLGALAFWTHPDGRIALFADSAFDLAPEPAALQAYADALGIAPVAPPEPGLLADAGYARLEAGPFTLIASLAGPAPAYQPGHAHCDALSFELSVGRTRAVTDTGVAEYVAGPLRDASRQTLGHATVEVGGEEQAEIWAPHRVGGRPRVRRTAFEPGRAVAGECAGWATPDSVHARRIEVEPAVVRVRDTLRGRARAVRMAFPLAPGADVALADDTATVRLADGATLRFSLPGNLRWQAARTPYLPAFGEVVERSALLGEGETLGDALTRIEVI